MNGYLPDVNLLLALAWPNHQFHQRATSWFSSSGDLPWHTCAVTQLGFVRLSSNPAFTPYAKTPLESALLLGAMAHHPQHSYLAECAPLDRERFAQIARNLHGHKQITDAYLACVAHEHGLALVTFDRRIGLICPFPDVVCVLSA